MVTPALAILKPTPVAELPQVTPVVSLRQTKLPATSFLPYGSVASVNPSFFTQGNPVPANQSRPEPALVLSGKAVGSPLQKYSTFVPTLTPVTSYCSPGQTFDELGILPLKSPGKWHHAESFWIAHQIAPDGLANMLTS